MTKEIIFPQIIYISVDGQALYFSFCNNLQISGINVINSPSKQVKLFKCIWATVRNLQIRAPEDSPNTDGLVIALSSQVQVLDSYIGTGIFHPFILPMNHNLPLV